MLIRGSGRLAQALSVTEALFCVRSPATLALSFALLLLLRFPFRWPAGVFALRRHCAQATPSISRCIVSRFTCGRASLAGHNRLAVLHSFKVSVIVLPVRAA
jgi:hypothetical protein